MSSYKVPQDVEAEDKLLGPFSFRQFLYLIIVAVAIGVGFLLFKILPPLVVIPLPFVVFFGALALPLRKDQPMEIYMAALLSFYLKPRIRPWEPDGIETLVYIAAPRNKEPERTKNISESEAEQRLRYLSSLSDSRGWSIRNVNQPASSMNADVFNEAQQTQDILDETGTVAQNLNQIMAQNDQRRHQQMLNQFQAAAAAPVVQPQAPVPPPLPDPYASLATLPQTPVAPTPQPVQPIQSVQPVVTSTPVVQPVAAPESVPQFNPYPSSISQAVILPLSEQQPAQPVMDTPQVQAAVPVTPESEPINTSVKPISPDIINLASNTNLSIETIAREAHRITEKEADLEDNEVIISLR